jgi:3-oxoacyl-[acyl-carrier-protein] synthase-3
MSQKFKVSIKAIEYVLGKNVETSEELLRDNPDWRIEDIEKKTGVKTRFVSDSDETATSLGIQAGKKLLSNNEDIISAEKIDALIFVTQSPDYFLPASACIIQNELGIGKNSICFDINQGCSGFVYALSNACAYIHSNLAENVLIICGETYTKYIGANDRTNRPLFSDAAAAILVSKSNKSISGFNLGTNGAGAKNLIVEEGAAKAKFGSESSPQLFMDGSKVFMFTLGEIPKSVKNILTAEGLTSDAIKMFVFHQASKLVIDSLEKKLGLKPNQVFRNYEDLGNTVSATIPIALKDLSDRGGMRESEKVLIQGFGVGLSWAGCIIEWDNIR